MLCRCRLYGAAIWMRGRDKQEENVAATTLMMPMIGAGKRVVD
jgi:hypothetical protein